MAVTYLLINFEEMVAKSGNNKQAKTLQIDILQSPAEFRQHKTTAALGKSCRPRCMIAGEEVAYCDMTPLSASTAPV